MKHVFIVDDSPVVRSRLTSLLGDQPGVLVVGQAELAFEALGAIRKLRPHFVILDISMPGGSGLNLLGNLRQAPSPPITIMLTNLAGPEYRQRCQELGADFFFDKSTEFEAAIETVRRCPKSKSASSPRT